nr:MAG TPA: hypothetical protein [Caudoviricetes sp.]
MGRDGLFLGARRFAALGSSALASLMGRAGQKSPFDFCPFLPQNQQLSCGKF